MRATIALAEAKQQRKQLIAELRGGDDGERRLAEILAGCREGKRCHLHKCPVCERRKMRARRRVPAAVVKSIGSLFEIVHIAVDEIQIRGKRRALNEEKVRAIAASMDLIGLQTPLTVRMQKKQVVLVTGWHRLSAAKRLGWDSIPCVVLIRDKTETRIWQIVENLYRAELTVLERAEHIEELRIPVRNVIEEGQVAPPGGHQPKEFGIKKTAKRLGLTKEEVRRSKAIAGILPTAKAKLRKLGLDDNQRALLEIAQASTPKAQLRAVKNIVKRKRAARDRNAATAITDKKTAAAIENLEADIREKEDALDSLKSDLAAGHKRLREIQDKLAVQDEVAVLHRTRSSAAADNQSGSEARSELTHGVAGKELTSPATAPTGDEDIPAVLDRRPLSPDDQRALDAAVAEWKKSTVRAVLIGISPVVQERFIDELRADIGSARALSS